MSENKILRSFIKTETNSHFPIQNLPYGIFKTKENQIQRAGTAIGNYVLDLSVLESIGIFENIFKENRNVFSSGSLNLFMSLEKTVWKEVRSVLQNILKDDNPFLRDNDELRKKCFIEMKNAEMCMPAQIGDYTDFYSSREHATNVGIMFRGKENALMPNWLHLPVAYHGRASSVILSGQEIIRPKGQTKADDAEIPSFGPTKLLDFELEMGFFIGPGNNLGEPIPVQNADDHIFGMVLVNDWSARDIQKWEYVPLGPFLAKNFATSISPWIVTLEALEPFKSKKVHQDPFPLPYLQSKGDWSYDINLEVSLKTEKLDESFVISRSNFKNLYWDICQQLAHHTVTGCNMRPGDLLASGTISGSAEDSYGSLLELTWRGEKPIELPNKEIRKFLADGDELKISGWCNGDGYKVGFGEVTGKILPAR
ncbi:MAG TPA: fumarylacetoacetase [Ignavibacteria bacterium]|nr:fumarylacetoacetase [Ignavibacteria bacterium]